MEKTLENLENFMREQDKSNLKRASDWNIWSKRFHDAGARMMKFARKCEEWDENLAKCTNWDDLPLEIKSFCVDRMDFNTRIRMRRVRRLEKSIVDSKKWPLRELRLEVYDVVSVTLKLAHTSEKLSTSRFPFESLLRSLLYTLNHCEIESIGYAGGGVQTADQQENYVDLMLPELRKSAPFGFSRLRFESPADSRIPLLLLKNCASRIEELTFAAFSKGVEDSMLAIRSPFLAERVEFLRSGRTGLHVKFVEKWIEFDAPIGNSLRFAANLAVFTKKFKDRIVAQSEKFVRIRMEDPKKHILVYQLYDFATEKKCVVIEASELVENIVKW